MATLAVTEGPASGQQFALEKHLLVLVGRDHQCTFQIVDTQISRRHFQLRYDEGEGRHYAIDFESSNGVSVNGNKIAPPQPLEDGDVIRISGTLIVYSVEDSPDAQRVTEILRKHGEGRHETQLES